MNFKYMLQAFISPVARDLIFRKLTRTLGFFIIAVHLFGCKPEEIILHGDISGLVTDASNNEPVEAAYVKINATNDSTRTGSDGTFIFKNLPPGGYELKTSKFGYDTSTVSTTVVSAEAKNISILLNGFGIPSFSVNYLDFGFDSTSLSFTISNIGKGKFSYFLVESNDRILVSPNHGDITNETDTITVTMDRTGLSENTLKEIIEVISNSNQVFTNDTIHVFLNGVADSDGNFYKVVKIGTQTWMAENLNVGKMVYLSAGQADNGIIEKYCYDNNKAYSEIYGGLYSWDEMMQYQPSDSGLIGTTRGICPDGWHIPTEKEYRTLVIDLGGEISNWDIHGDAEFSAGVGNKLMEEGQEHWGSGNDGTNESGFTALPAGHCVFDDSFYQKGTVGIFWTSTCRNNNPHVARSILLYFEYPEQWMGIVSGDIHGGGGSVRCVKNPGNR